MKKRKKILMVCTLPPPVHGSAMVSQYIRESSKLNNEFQMDFVNLSTSRNMDEIGKTNPISVIVKLYRFFNALLKCFFFLLRYKYDACYCAITCHGSGFLKDAPFVLLCKLFRKKIIIHQHNKGMSNDVDKPIYKWLLPFVYRNAVVILLSWKLYPDIEKVVTKDQIRICPNGIPTVQISEQDRSVHVPRLLFLSNLIVSKGVLELLDSCKILMDQGYAFECIFIGGESKDIDVNRFEKEVAIRNLEKIVLYKGRKYGEEKFKELQESNIFVFPTSDDCFPLVLLEAMQMSLPIIATNIGGIPDIVIDNETGYIINSNSPEKLAKKIQDLIDNPERTSHFGANGLKRFNQFFTIKSWEDNLEKILCDVVYVDK